MEDDLEKMKNGGQPQQKMRMEDDLKKWKTTSKKVIEDDLNHNFKNQP